MLFYSTNSNSETADFREATIKGQAPDKGLYFPESIPVLPSTFFEEIESYSKEEIAFEVIRPYVGNTLPVSDLQTIISETVDFDFPLVRVDDQIFSLELYHGPTLAFKDVGARFMSRCLGYFMKNSNRAVTVLVATSGDTGGAVADGFYGVDGVQVVILYPSGKVSSIQELQLTTLGKNITAIEVDGTFDDCQHMVKSAFTDQELNKKLFLTSANSINVARWLPQQFYYLFAYRQWDNKKVAPVISVPSGNFGNICAGLLAQRSGLPVKHFVAACNANDVIPSYLQTGTYVPKPTQHTISNAMDVGDPSNFVRILHLFEQEHHSLTQMLTAYSFTDEQTRETIKNIYENQHYLLDPHGAVGYLALRKYIDEHQEHGGFFLETAHPVKFYDVVEPVIGKKVDLPLSVQHLLDREKQAIKLPAIPAALKDYLLQ